MKAKVSNDIINKIIDVMLDCGIDKRVITLSEKMDLYLPYLFYEKLIISDDENDKKSLSKNLLGVYGNFFATLYFSGMGYNVKNEFVLKDFDGNWLGKTDIAFKDKDDNTVCCEVKAISNILGENATYIDSNSNDIKYNTANQKKELNKYKSVGKKLLKQVKKIIKSGNKPMVVVYNGCYIDNDIKIQLDDLGVFIMTLQINIKDLENAVNNIVNEIKYASEDILDKKIKN